MDDVAEALGVRLVDVLQLTSVFVIVEGKGDEAVLEVVIGDELARLGARLLPMHGTKSLSSVIDSQFIFNLTSAGVVVCLDRTDADRVKMVESDVHELLRRGEDSAAKRRLEKAVGTGQSEEERAAYRFLRAALDTGRLDRVTVFGFQQPDIIYYLPVQCFIRGAESWEQVGADYRDTRHENRGKPENIKAWLSRPPRSARVSAQEFRKAASELYSPSPEFTGLLERVAAQADVSRSRSGDHEAPDT